MSPPWFDLNKHSSISCHDNIKVSYTRIFHFLPTDLSPLHRLPTTHFVTHPFFPPSPSISLLFSIQNPTSQHSQSWEEKISVCLGQWSYFSSLWNELQNVLWIHLYSTRWMTQAISLENGCNLHLTPFPSPEQLKGQAEKWMEGVKRPTTESNCCFVHQKEKK